MSYHIPQLGKLTPSRGNRLSRAFGQTILRVTGWKLEGNIPNIPKAVYVGAPHTSNWDFPIALTYLVATGIRMSWMGKHTFVNGFLKPFWLHMGGIPIDRRAAHGVVGEMVMQFNKHSELLLGLAPEGTRSKVERWKMGFYHIAKGAGVPIVPILLDYGRKRIAIGSPIEAVENVDVVKKQLSQFYRGAIAQHPQNYTPILPLEEDSE
ncbi:MAG: acyltransferase [Chloroflexi bacterium]|nr:MAG: acyltransferase [Chloroflexota bacterium]